ncbi:MAG: dihydrodipicolinate synthase family protein, partial [Methylobacter sp.]|nr:dihydrodipicolinate synthase family protein [Methylobacter sp.]
CDMLPATVGRLSHIRNIVGVKEATADLSRVKQIRDLAGDYFAIYTGDDASSLEFCLLGGNGSITVTGNVAPKLVHNMIMAAIAGDSEAALAIDKKLVALHQKLFIESNPIPVKWAVAEMGLMPKGIRLPLTWLTENCFEAVRDALRQAEVVL